MDVLQKGASEATMLREAGGSPVRMLQVLHAEDDPNDAFLCRLQLKEAGLDIAAHVVASKEEFLAALGARHYDLVLADYKLPGWSGIEVLRILEEDGRDIPCILLTGSVGEEIAAQCIKLGAVDYILKDRPTRLPFAIASALEEREQRESHKEAERKSNMLASIVESSLDAIIGATEDGTIVNWNPGAERMFGYSADEIRGTLLWDLFSAGEAVDAHNSQNPGQAIARYETQAVTKSGELMDLAVTVSPIRDSEGRATGRSAIVRDVTEMKRQQREQLTAQKLEAIGQLAGGVAHDFNNLLTVINGYARMLRRKGSADSEKLDAILQAGERGQRLTKQLLMFSRKQITQFVPVNLNDLVMGFLDMLRPLIGADIELRTVLAPDLPPVFADAGQLEQVIMNLVVNARDAMPDGGSVIIATTSRKPEEAGNKFGTVTLLVSDTGVGMSEEVQAHMFEPFFTTKEVGRGTGLGLATSCGIVAKCKGQLHVSSAPGKGTTFSIELPACGEEEVRPATAVLADEAMKVGSGTILLAEDDPTVRALVQALLEDHGYQVLAAENGRKALDLCGDFAGPLTALVTDVVMPEMNGRTLAQQARLIRPGLKVIFVSGYVDKGLKEEDLSAGSSAFLEKPFTGDALLKILGGFSADVR